MRGQLDQTRENFHDLKIEKCMYASQVLNLKSDIISAIFIIDDVARFQLPGYFLYVCVIYRSDTDETLSIQSTASASESAPSRQGFRNSQNSGHQSRE